MKIILFTYLIFFSLTTFAQEKDLILYTDPTCQRCQASKQFLQKSGISFENKSIMQSENVQDMWVYLRNAGVKNSDNIEFPVVIMNNVVIFPVIEAGKNKNVDLEEFFINLDKFYKFGTTIPYNYSGQDFLQIYEGKHDNKIAIERLSGTFYIIIGSFTNLTAAKSVLNDLINKSYKNPEIVESKGKYRVSANRLNDLESILNFTSTLPPEYQDFWILFKDKELNELVVDNPDGSFGIVVASFPGKEKAEKLIKELNAKGFKNASIYEKTNTFRVLISTFSNYEEAKEFLKKQTAFNDLWMVIY